MTTQVLIRKLNKEVADLRKDVSQMKRVIFAAANDPEGAYHALFVKKIITRTKEKSKYQFTSKADFLKKLHAAGK